jgi:hypothetical protein
VPVIERLRAIAKALNARRLAAASGRRLFSSAAISSVVSFGFRGALLKNHIE